MSYDDYKWKKRKYYIRINCWIIMLILVAILCFMFPIISNAEESYPSKMSELDSNWKDKLVYYEGYQEINSDYANTCASNILASSDGSDFSLVDDVNIDWTGNPYNVREWTDYQIFFIAKSSNSYSLHAYGIYSNNYPNLQLAYIGSRNSSGTFTGSVIGTVGQTTVSSGNKPHFFHITLNYNSSTNTFVYNSNSVSNAQGNIDGLYYAIQNTGNSFVYASCPLNSVNGNGGRVTGTFSNNASVYFNESLIDVNYSDSSSEDIIYPDGSGGSDDNNLYMRTADWQFNIPKYWGNVTSSSVNPQYTNNWGYGNIIFYGLLNDYQKSNYFNFYLDFSFHIWISGRQFSDIAGNDYSSKFYGSYNYTDSVTLSNFISNNNTLSFSVDDIFQNAVNFNGDNIYELLTDIKTYNSIDNWNWYITCDACLTSGYDHSGHIVEKYNFISQVSEETNNTITDNTNPFIPDEGDPDDSNNQAPSDTQYSKNGINISINNNPNFNNTVNGGSISNNIDNSDGTNPFNILIDKLFGNGNVQEGSIGDITQSQLLSNTGASRWLAVMNDSFSFIPLTVWAEIQMFLGIVLGILVVGFILRIILDFL